ncbi:aspartyl/asparaginyl beta-hydroxylase domain-containing protein [Moritella sp. Urea-trap-13]|uniref:aspartyl/asparaginyl beta-hydroxylase domain-containing protein n=1 Tax=Moritella sp. Urea-trap-13 TaxID=2058327 RepID=UPI000C327C23|nr:aspartyl/asparaginyl beta-hydroxylase domain-containing protein [Moritella sp. Urea-trap-13]PKH07400.1 aspartyl beta-hydroxylase [Moritella sp. Urea-trap-13]
MPNIIYAAQCSFQCDVTALQRELRTLMNNDWVDHINRQCYSGGWDVQPLRTLQKNALQHPILQSFALEEQGNWIDLPVLATLPKIRRILNWFQCDIEAVRLMRLKPDAHIQSHQDKGLAMEYGFARFHIPICAAEQVEFMVNGKLLPMKNGELWYLNADATHSVRHVGNDDRINLVIDCKVNKWLQQQILSAVIIKN